MRTPNWADALTPEGIETIARICHEANRAWCESHGDDSQVPWNDAPAWQRESCKSGVTTVIEAWKKRKALSPRTLHDAWVENKIENGWVFGREKNAELKTHPCLAPWDSLNPRQRLKDVLFLNLVLTFLG